MIEYVELHCHTNYSLLDGASHPEELLDRALELGMNALAITDHAGLYGAVRFWRAATERGIRPIIGTELTIDEGYHLVLLARNMRGYTSLCHLISHAQLRGSKGHPALDKEILAEHTEGLICLSGCAQGEISTHLLAGNRERALTAGRYYVDIFGPDDFYIELQRHRLREDHELNEECVELAQELGARCVATNDVHYAHREGYMLQDVLACIKHRTTLDESANLRRPNSEYYLKSAEEMSSLFADYPEALANARRIADRCRVDLDLTKYRLPTFPVPPGETPFSYLYALCQQGIRRKYHPVTPAASHQLAHELGVIERAGLAEYFLLVWDIVRYAKERSIPAQGRGSAANSLVAYVLDITKVDPIRHNLLFERFLSEAARTMPDIDVDFSASHREEVLQYVYQKYGKEHTAMVCNVVTFRARSAVRDVGKALGFPLGLLDQIAKSLDTRRATEVGAVLSTIESFAHQTTYLPWQQLTDLCRQIDRFPRHLSIHVGGMLVTGPPLIDIVPLERATMPGRVVSQYNKDDIEDLGLIKIDLLSLRTLSMIHDAMQLIEEKRGIKLDLEAIPLDDPEVYSMLCRADTIGTFQVESRAQAQNLPRMRPRCLEDIIVEIALIRPGPLQGNMVNPYMLRRQGREPVTYMHPLTRPATEETLGVIVFQEQVMRVAMDVAGFTPGEADQLRRAISRHRSHHEMKRIQNRFISGALGNGLNEQLAQDIYSKLEGFASYGFCKSHAAAFAKTAYDSCYLKIHYPEEFYCALLNNQPMGFYRPSVIVSDAKRHGVELLPVHINQSRDECTLEQGRLRVGLRYVHGLGERGRVRIETERAHGPFSGLRDFCRRTRLARKVVEHLIMVGAMACWEVPRRELLWELGQLRYSEEMDLAPPAENVDLPPLSHAERVGLEYGLLGLAIGDHIMSLYRYRLDALGVRSSTTLSTCSDGDRVLVAGRVIVRQAPPTAKGFVFITLEDEDGLINLVVRPGIYACYRRTLRSALLLMVEGKVQRADGVLNVIVERASDLV